MTEQKQPEEKDIAIIGGGPGGYVAAIHAAHLGASVALFEMDTLGGTCLNHGCIPTKAMVRSVEVLTDARNGAHFGIDITGISVNLKRIIARKNEVVSQLVKGIEQHMISNKISVYRGSAQLVSPELIRVNDDEVKARHVVIATGSTHAPLDIPGANLPGVLSTNDILAIESLPKTLIIIGGNYVGIEFACLFDSLGSKVTILKRKPLLLGQGVDEEISRRFGRIFVQREANVITGAAVQEIRKHSSGLEVVWETPEGEKSVCGEAVLMATGRTPYTEGLGLAQLGVKMEGPNIIVNESLETNIPGIYAIGDVLGTNMLAHVASYEGEIAVGNATGRPRKADYRAVPSCIFTHPEVAAVGLTETEVKEQGIPYKVNKFPFSACGRAVAMNETAGMVKFICNQDDGHILGMHVMGPHASELIAEGTLAMQTGATVTDIVHTIHAHPTLSESVREAAMMQQFGAIHFGKV